MNVQIRVEIRVVSRDNHVKNRTSPDDQKEAADHHRLPSTPSSAGVEGRVSKLQYVDGNSLVQMANHLLTNHPEVVWDLRREILQLGRTLAPMHECLADMAKRPQPGSIVQETLTMISSVIDHHPDFANSILGSIMSLDPDPSDDGASLAALAQNRKWSFLLEDE